MPSHATQLQALRDLRRRDVTKRLHSAMGDRGGSNMAHIPPNKLHWEKGGGIPYIHMQNKYRGKNFMHTIDAQKDSQRGRYTTKHAK